jgi:16S rRNA (guanine527-N7)-methyltransferase
MSLTEHGDKLREAAAELGLTPDDATIDSLLAYLGLLQRWNTTYNLTAVRDPGDMLTQHLVDCLAVVGPLQRERPPGGRRILDVGSGGGLPGVVLSILRPEDTVTCIDTVGKKAAFIRQVALELRLRNLTAEHARVEQWRGVPFDVVTSRAFASLSDFVHLTEPHLAPAAFWMAMKGKRPDDEIAALPGHIEVFHVEHLTVPGLAADRCLVWMRPRPT